MFSDVDWPRSRFNWSRVPAIAAACAPDLALLPGDLLDRAGTAGDPETAREAGAWLGAALPGIPVLVAPGEAESPVRERVASLWPERTEILANEPRRLEIRGAPLEVFVADPKVDPAPWGLATEEGRPVARVRGRTETSILRGRAAVSPSDGFEAGFGFRVADALGTLEIRLAGGWRVRTRSGDRRFRLFRRFESAVPLELGRGAPFAAPIGTWCRAHVRVVHRGDATELFARFWPDGAREPSSWNVEAADAAPERPREPVLAFGVRHGVVEIAELRSTLGSDDFTDPRRFVEGWEQNSALAAWCRSSPAAPTRIVLAHHPDVALVLDEGGLPRPDLIVAGHTHGGQIRLPVLGAAQTDTRLGRAYDRGIFEVAGSRLFITAGVGTSILPVRWDVPPDVALLTLVPGRRDEPATLVDSAAPEAKP